MTSTSSAPQPRKLSPVVRWGLPLAASGLVAGFVAGRTSAPTPAVQEPQQQTIFLQCPDPNATEEVFPQGPVERIRVERIESDQGTAPRVVVTWRGDPPVGVSVATGFNSRSGNGTFTVELVSDTNTNDGVTTVTGPPEYNRRYAFVNGGVGEGLGADYHVTAPPVWVEGAAGGYSPRSLIRSETQCSFGV